MKKLVTTTLLTMSLIALAIFIVPMISDSVYADTDTGDSVQQEDQAFCKGKDWEDTQDQNMEKKEALPEEPPGEPPEKAENVSEEAIDSTTDLDNNPANTTAKGPPEKDVSTALIRSESEIPVAVFNNELEYRSARLGDSISVILKNRISTNCGVRATINTGLEKAELFKINNLEQLGTETATFNALAKYFALGYNYVKVDFDYGPENKETVILHLFIQENLGGETENDDYMPDGSYTVDYEWSEEPTEDDYSYSSAAETVTRTGDDSPIMLIILLMMISILGGITIIRRQDNI